MRSCLVGESEPPRSHQATSRVGPSAPASSIPEAWRVIARSAAAPEVDFVAQGVKGGARDRSRGIAAGDVNHDGLCDLAHVGSQGIEIIRGCRGLNLIGAECVEVSPPYDTTGATAIAGAHVAYELICLYHWARTRR